MREFPLFFFERRRVHFNLAWVFEKRHDYGLNFLPKRAIMKEAGGSCHAEEPIRRCGLHLAGVHGGRTPHAHFLAGGHGRVAVGKERSGEVSGARLAAPPAVGL